MAHGYLQSLLREHQKLEQQIAREMASRAPDHGEVAKLKRMKLLFKDRIADVQHQQMRTSRSAGSGSLPL